MPFQHFAPLGIGRPALQAQRGRAGISLENISNSRTGFQIAGPNARKLLERVTRSDVSAEAFRFLDVKQMPVGLVDCIVQRVSYTDDLGYEIYTTPMSQRALWHALTGGGSGSGPAPVRHARHDEPAVR